MKVPFQILSVATVLAVGMSGVARAQDAAGFARVRAPVRLSAPNLEYPAELKTAQIQGTVVVVARVDTTGMVEPGSVTIAESADTRFNERAKEFVLKSRFQPAREGSRKIPMYVRVPVVFDLRSWR